MKIGQCCRFYSFETCLYDVDICKAVYNKTQEYNRVGFNVKLYVS